MSSNAFLGRSGIGKRSYIGAPIISVEPCSLCFVCCGTGGFCFDFFHKRRKGVPTKMVDGHSSMGLARVVIDRKSGWDDHIKE